MRLEGDFHCLLHCQWSGLNQYPEQHLAPSPGFCSMHSLEWLAYRTGAGHISKSICIPPPPLALLKWQKRPELLGDKSYFTCSLHSKCPYVQLHLWWCAQSHTLGHSPCCRCLAISVNIWRVASDHNHVTHVQFIPYCILSPSQNTILCLCSKAPFPFLLSCR